MTNMIKAKNWNDLVGLVSRDGKYKFVIEVDHCSGWIKPTDETSEEFGYYLSTHTFYEKFYRETNKVLKEYGFDVEVESWG